jgi:5-methylcytosine-specific restriction endonuclease McrA
MPRKSRVRTSVSHRVPPKPPSWFCDRGTCRFCGEPIIENGKVNGRKHWHQPCADIWKIMNNPADARTHVTRRENFTCQDCGWHHPNGQFEVDHVEPLYEANGDPRYWQPGNLALLCVDCHKSKTKQDMIRFRAYKLL